MPSSSRGNGHAGAASGAASGDAAPEAEPERLSDAEVEAEIQKLTKLSLIQYERQREAAAARLAVRATMLDKLVAAARGDGKQGRALNLPEPEPWADPVNGATLLNDLSAALRRHVVMHDYEADAAALWVVHTYLLDSFGVSPRLAITSPEKGCGKTTALDVLTRLVWRPLLTANATAAAIFRVIEKARPTLLFDEVETFLPDNEDLRGILNTGHRRGGFVTRTVGEDFEPRQFSTWAACACAQIGKLPSTLTDCSVSIELRSREIIIATPEKLDFALRSDPSLIDDVGLIVLDEGHMIGPSERENRYETLVQRLLRRADSADRRIVCLSAILPSGDELDDLTAWIRADEPSDAVRSDWRPTRQRFGMLAWLWT